MKRTVTLTLELDAGEDQPAFNREANATSFMEQLDRILSGSLEGTRITHLRVESDLEIEPMLTISTGHITKDTADAFDAKMGDDGIPAFFPKGDYGWFVFVPDQIEPECPADLASLLRFAKEKGCTWLVLDCDAEQVDGLPTYDW